MEVGLFDCEHISCNGSVNEDSIQLIQAQKVSASVLDSVYSCRNNDTYEYIYLRLYGIENDLSH